jgi:hypothetical protein
MVHLGLEHGPILALEVAVDDGDTLARLSVQALALSNGVEEESVASHL